MTNQHTDPNNPPPDDDRSGHSGAERAPHDERGADADEPQSSRKVPIPTAESLHGPAAEHD